MVCGPPLSCPFLPARPRPRRGTPQPCSRRASQRPAGRSLRCRSEPQVRAGAAMSAFAWGGYPSSLKGCRLGARFRVGCWVLRRRAPGLRINPKSPYWEALAPPPKVADLPRDLQEICQLLGGEPRLPNKAPDQVPNPSKSGSRCLCLEGSRSSGYGAEL